MRLFQKPADYLAFERVLAEGLERYPVELLTYCLMPNHWHLVVRPQANEALGRWLGWVGVTHVRRHHEHYHSRGGGHLYQGRFKSFPVSSDEHFLTLCRYVEANARRAKLVARAEEWPWCGLWRRQHPGVSLPPLPLAEWPVERPAELVAAGESQPPRGRPGATSRVRPTRPAPGRAGLGSSHRQTPAPRFHPPRPRPTKEQQSVMSLFLSHRCSDDDQNES